MSVCLSALCLSVRRSSASLYDDKLKPNFPDLDKHTGPTSGSLHSADISASFARCDVSMSIGYTEPIDAVVLALLPSQAFGLCRVRGVRRMIPDNNSTLESRDVCSLGKSQGQKVPEASGWVGQSFDSAAGLRGRVDRNQITYRTEGCCWKRKTKVFFCKRMQIWVYSM